MASLEEFIKLNSRSTPLGVIWDTPKAFLRGVLIQQISYIKKQSQTNEITAGENVKKPELQYVEDPTTDRYRKWSERQETYKKIVLKKVENN